MLLNFQEGEILSFHKPYGWTSFQVVGRVRWWLKKKVGIRKIKVGHAGTLDPLATGVLLVCTGKATKKIEELQHQTKEYVATLKLGATTPSFDRETEEDATYPTSHITRELAESTLNQFKGDIMQIPPRFSAVKVNGKRAYKFARKGEEIELEPKKVRISEIELLAFGEKGVHPSTGSGAQELKSSKVQGVEGNPTLEMQIRVVCSKGTYIRSLARDLGVSLGSGAYLLDLCRTRVGNYRLSECIDAEHFAEWLESQEWHIDDQENTETK